MDIARTERLTEEVKARAGTRPACGWRGDWGAGANICGFRWMSQRLQESGKTAKPVEKSRPNNFQYRFFTLMRMC